MDGVFWRHYHASQVVSSSEASCLTGNHPIRPQESAPTRWTPRSQWTSRLHNAGVDLQALEILQDGAVVASDQLLQPFDLSLQRRHPCDGIFGVLLQTLDMRLGLIPLTLQLVDVY